MKKILFILTLLLFSVCSVFATDSQYLWANSANSSSAVVPLRMKFDASGNFYVLYKFSGSITISGNTRSSYGDVDACLTKYDASGNLLWMRIIGTAGADDFSAMDIDSNGEVYIAGTVPSGAGTSYYYDTGAGTVTASATTGSASGGDNAVLVFKYASTGALTKKVYGLRQNPATTPYTTSFSVSDVAINGSTLAIIGHVSLISSATASGTYMVNGNTNVTTSIGTAYKQCYLAQITGVTSSTWVGSSINVLYEMPKSQDYPTVSNIISDGTDYYVSGSYQSSISQTPHVVSLPSPQSQDMFIAKISASGVQQWINLVQGVGAELPIGLKCDGSGVYFASIFNSAELSIGQNGIYNAGNNTLSKTLSKVPTDAEANLLVIKYSLTGTWLWDYTTLAKNITINKSLNTLSKNSEFLSCSYSFSGTTEVEPDLLVSNLSDAAVILLDPSTGESKGVERIPSSGDNEVGTCSAFGSDDRLYLAGTISASTVQLGNSQITSSISGVQNSFIAKYCPLVRLYGLKSVYPTSAAGTQVILSGTPSSGGVFSSTTNTITNGNTINLQMGVNTLTYSITKVGECINSYTKTATVKACYTNSDITFAVKSSFCSTEPSLKLVASVGTTTNVNPVGSVFSGENGSVSQQGSDYYFTPSAISGLTRTLTYEYTTTGCSKISATATVSAVSGPIVTLVKTTGCQGTTFTISTDDMDSHFAECDITVTSVGDLTESFSFNTVSPGETFSYIPTKVENYDVHVYAIENGCALDVYNPTGAVTVIPKPTVSFSGTTTVCINGSTSLTADASGATSPYTYAWNGGGSSYTKAFNNLASNTNAIITVTDINGCQTVATQPITVNTPSVTISPASASICQSSSTTLTATPGFSSYNWSSGTSSTGTLGVVTVNPTITNSYTVTATDAIGCSATSAAQQITVNPLPTVTITPTPANGTVCAGATVSLQASAGNSYLWNTGATTSSISTGTAGTYNVTVTDANNCSNSATVASSVTVHALPNVQVSVDKAGVCTGGALVLTANGGNSYTWSSGATARAQTYLADANPTVTATGTVSYTVTGTDANGCTNTATTSSINVWKPVVTITPENPAACAGTSTTLTANGTGTSAYSYLWNSSVSGATHSAAAGSNNTVVVTDGNGCTASASKVVSTTALPTVTIDGVNEACDGTSTTLTASGASTYTWSTGNPLTGTATSVAVSNTLGTVTVTGTDGNGCVNTATKTITVNAKPTVSISGTSAVCSGGTISLTAQGADSFVWQDNSTNTALSLSNATTPQYVRVIGTTSNGCKDTADLTTTIYSLPTVSIVGGAQKYLYLGELGTTFTATGATSYAWSNGLGSSAESASVSSAGDYIVTGTDNHGCENTATATLTVLTACTWNGTAWLGGYTPDATKDVVINGRYKGASFNCKDLSVSDSLIVDTAKYVVVEGNFTNNANGKVLIKSLPTGNTTNLALPIRKDGAMIFKGTVTNNGTFKVEQYYTAGAIAHWVSIPVSPVSAGAYIEQGIIRPFTDGTNSTYGAKITNVNQSLDAGKGYNFEKYTSGAFTITGTPNTSDYTYTLTKGTSARSMMGNPYTSAIDILSVNWTFTNTKKQYSVWNPIAKAYASYNVTSGVKSNGATRYIGMGQGYWVYASDNTTPDVATVSYNRGVQSIADFGSFKDEESSKAIEEVRFVVSSSDVTDEAVVAFINNASNKDEKFDSYKTFNDVFDIYLLVESKPMTVNAIPAGATDLNEVVYIKTTKETICTLNTSSSDVINGKNIVVENIKTGDILPISALKNYSFKVSPEDSAYFRLKQAQEVLDINEIETTVGAYSVNGIIYFNAPKEVKIDIYDICGKKIATQEELKPYDANKYLNSVLLVSFKTKNQTISKKVIVQ